MFGNLGQNVTDNTKSQKTENPGKWDHSFLYKNEDTPSLHISCYDCCLIEFRVHIIYDLTLWPQCLK